MIVIPVFAWPHAITPVSTRHHETMSGKLIDYIRDEYYIDTVTDGEVAAISFCSDVTLKKNLNPVSVDFIQRMHAL